jgi:hypothetical protein
MRRPGQSYSDVTLRLIELGGNRALTNANRSPKDGPSRHAFFV